MTTSSSLKLKRRIGRLLGLRNLRSLLGIPRKGEFKPGIAITFDDTFTEEWLDLHDHFERVGGKATFYLTTPGKLSSDQINAMYKLFLLRHELGAHGFKHLNAKDFLQDHTPKDYFNEEVIPIAAFFRRHNIPLTSYAYPYGSRTEESDYELLKYFHMLRGTTYTTPKRRVAQLDEAFVYKKGKGIVFGVGIDHNYGNTLDELEEGLIRAKREHAVLVLYAHKPGKSKEKYHVDPDFIGELLDRVVAHDLIFYTISELSIKS
jgi:peptidoglycan/xylan/chitin deacetylase (PgdA/CDA1 family)